MRLYVRDLMEEVGLKVYEKLGWIDAAHKDETQVKVETPRTYSLRSSGDHRPTIADYSCY